MVAAGVGLVGAGLIVRSIAAYQQTKDAAEIARFNARLEKRNAEQQALMVESHAELLDIERTREASALLFDLDVYDDIAQRATASTRAAIGASGTEFSGSNLLVAAEQAEQIALQRSVMVYQSETRQADLQDEAAFQRFQAAEIRRTGAFQARLGRRQAASLMGGLSLQLASAALGAGSEVHQQFARRRLLRSRRTTQAEAPPMGFAPGE